MKLKDFAYAIKRDVSAVEVGELIGLKPNKEGFCRCPFHGEKTGSMKLYPGSRGWYCFGRHRGGDVISLVQEYYGLDFKGAIELLNEDFDLGLPIGREASKEQEEAAKKRAEEREERERKQKEAEKARNDAYLRYLDVGQQIRQLEADKETYAPVLPGDDIDPRFAAAIVALDLLREEAEDLALVCFGKKGDE